MPLYFQQHIEKYSSLGIWEITEPESFFLSAIDPVKNIAHPLKRLQHLSAYYLLHQLAPGFPMGEIIIDKNNKPHLLSGEYFFSLAHSGNFAAAIFSKNEHVGIDIESITDKPFIVRQKFLKANEITFLDENDRQANVFSRYTRAWCLKEAVYKCGGNGSISLKEHIAIKQKVGQSQDQYLLDLKVHDVSKEYLLHTKTLEKLCLAWVLGKNVI